MNVGERENLYKSILEKCQNDIKDFPDDLKNKIQIIPLFYESHKEVDNVDQTGLSDNNAFKNQRLQIVLHHTAIFENKSCIELFIRRFSDECNDGVRGVAAHFLIQTVTGGKEKFTVDVFGREYEIDPINRPYIMFFCLDAIPFHVAINREKDINTYISKNGVLIEADSSAPKEGLIKYTMNYSTIGIEVLNPGTRYQYTPLDATEQILKDTLSPGEGNVQKLIVDLVLELYNSLSEDSYLLPVITHAIADPERRQDINSGICSIIGIYKSLYTKYPDSARLSWVNDLKNIDDCNENIDMKAFFKSLSNIGYMVNDKEKKFVISPGKRVTLVEADHVISSLNMFSDTQYTSGFQPCFWLAPLKVKGKVPEAGAFKVIVKNIPDNTYKVIEDDNSTVIDCNNLDSGLELLREKLLQNVENNPSKESKKVTFLGVDGGHLRVIISDFNEEKVGSIYDAYTRSVALVKLTPKACELVNTLDKKGVKII